MLHKIRRKLNKNLDKKELLLGSAISLAIKITGMLISYVVILLISKKYGAEGVGFYSLTNNFLNTVAIVGTLGLNVAVLRYVGQYKGNTSATSLRDLFKFTHQLAIPATIIVALLVSWQAEFLANTIFKNSDYILVFRYGAFFIPFFALNLIDIEFIRGLKAIRVSEYLRSINRPLIIIVLVLSVSFGFGKFDPIIAFMIGLVMTYIFSLLYIRSVLGKREIKEVDVEGALTRKELLNTSMPMMVTSVSAFLLANMGGFFIEAFRSTAEVGVYNVIVKISSLVSLVLVAVNTISAPKFSQYFWEKKDIELKKSIQYSTKLIFLSSCIIATLLVIFSRQILQFFGEEFLIGTIPLFILIAGQIINSFSGSVGLFLNMSGNQKVMRNAILITLLITIIGFYYVIPNYGVLGASVVTTFGGVMLNVICVLFVFFRLKIKTYYSPFNKII